MARKPRLPEDDDGRTIADMSGVSSPTPFGFRHQERGSAPMDRRDGQERPEWESAPYTRSERRMYVLAALKAALLIALVFIAGLGFAIWLMLTLWL